MVKNVKNKIKNSYKLKHASSRYVEAMIVRWLENLSFKNGITQPWKRKLKYTVVFTYVNHRTSQLSKR